MHTDDTIVAISTPAGRGGIGVVRLSGPEALSMAQKVLRPRSRIALSALDEAPHDATATLEAGQQVTSPALTLAPWRVTYAELPDEQGAVIDRVLVSYFRQPHSYTTEDVVEVSCHGSPVVLRFLLERFLAARARLAEPGEFTMRAFLNGRIDLTQAEAVRDLIDARTLYQAKVAAGQIEGAVSHRLSPIKKQLVDLISLLEAGIDFAEDDISIPQALEIETRLSPIMAELTRLAQSFVTGKIIHQGLSLAIVGRPNVGKSSIFNRLLQQERAIVTATPGTTRDLVSESMEIDGIPLRFIDTAGVREAYDEAESIGVRKSYEAAADSDVALLVLDGTQELGAEDRDLLVRLRGLGKVLPVVNKCDLPLRLTRESLLQELGRLAPEGGESHDAAATVRVLFVSALTGEGVEDLTRAISETALPALSGGRESQFLTSVRQEKLVQESLEALDAARKSLEAAVPHEMLLLDLYGVLKPLDAITGETTVEDILGNIFSKFCIGK